ncbi:angiotensin-converting enzyme-like [Dermacentor albipictus]|uniref:angiotensin-converting enzyme-like n=1 Tax=Dermacentor albipictus TaxID=60249 RepID=UPI0038FCD4AC
MAPPHRLMWPWLVGMILAAVMTEAHGAARQPVEGDNEDEDVAQMYACYANYLVTQMNNRVTNAVWNYANNLTEYNKNNSVKARLEMKKLEKEVWKNVTKYKWTKFEDPVTRRIFEKLSVLGTAMLSDDKQNELLNIVAEMLQNHASGKICPFLRKTNTSEECNLSLEPEIKNILKDSRNYYELQHVWNEWRKVAGKPMKERYLRYVKLMNEAARLNGFKDASGLWQDVYEYDGFERNMAKLWEQLLPLYQELHAYVRSKLRAIYGPDKILEDGPIPAHLLGHLHSQDWIAVTKMSRPYPNKPAVDITGAMKERNMTVLDMFKMSEEFFTSMGLPPMPQTFWERSVLTKPTDRKIVCHPSAWDFYIGKDVRIKQCTEVKMDDLFIVHHEMGHVEYFLKYAKQPVFFRAGANPGFHEAIGDTIALSVATLKHLKAVGLLQDRMEDEETGINYLHSVAMAKVALIPSVYVFDLWRWNVFKGNYKPEDYNKAWWTLLLNYQGICPGVARAADDFDPPSKYHISANVPYIRYFASIVLQFQFYKALCEEANHTGPLYKCDFYRSKEAGKLFGDVMELGYSKPWPEALAMLTKGRTKEMDASAMLEYFEPLYIWLKEHNKGKYVGWRNDNPTACPTATRICPRKGEGKDRKGREVNQKST